MMRFLRVLQLGLVLNLFCFSFVNAEEKSSTSIDFEGEVVEGLNRQPLDSLSQISESDKNRDKAHLYRKRKSFQEENTQLANELLENYR